ncbi:hypothetical protein D9M71_677350 [compost metagenome]
MVALDGNRLGHLAHGHGGGFLDDAVGHALVVGRQVQHHHEGHPAIAGHLPEERADRLQPACRGANTHHRKVQVAWAQGRVLRGGGLPGGRLHGTEPCADRIVRPFEASPGVCGGIIGRLPSRPRVIAEGGAIAVTVRQRGKCGGRASVTQLFGLAVIGAACQPHECRLNRAALFGSELKHDTKTVRQPSHRKE